MRIGGVGKRRVRSQVKVINTYYMFFERKPETITRICGCKMKMGSKEGWGVSPRVMFYMPAHVVLSLLSACDHIVNILGRTAFGNIIAFLGPVVRE